MYNNCISCISTLLDREEVKMIVLDERDKRPIYEQVVDKISDLIARGILKADEQMPSVRNLAVQLSINPNTVAKAYLELDRRGYTYSVKGKGSFVAGNEKVLRDKQNDLKEELKTLCGRAKKIRLSEDDMIEIIRKEMS